MTSTCELECPSTFVLRTTPITRAPCQVAICVAACPTLPLTPMTSTVSPAFGIPARRRPSIAVTNGTPMPAASSHEMPSASPPPLPPRPRDAWHGCRRGGCRDRRMSRTPRGRSSPSGPHHDAGIVAARCAREDRVRHQPGRGLHVRWIDGGGLDLDQQVVFAARQRVRLDDRRERSGIGGLGTTGGRNGPARWQVEHRASRQQTSGFPLGF